MIYTCPAERSNKHAEIQKPRDLVCYSNIYDITCSFSENVYSEPKVMCQNMELFVYLGVI